MKKIYFVLLIILSTLIGCSSNTVSNIDIHSSEYSKFDNILKNQQYTKPINSTVTYSWNTVNFDKNSLFELKNTSTVDLLHDTKDINMSEGVDVSRQNFYFSTVNKSSQSIDFEFKFTAISSLK